MNTSALRTTLLDTLHKVSNGEMTHSRGNAIARLATGAVDTIRLEMEVHDFKRSNNGNAAAGVEL